MKAVVFHGIGDIRLENVRLVHKIKAGRPDALDLLRNGEIDMVINTPSTGKIAHTHEKAIRALAVGRGIPCFTTIAAAAAAVNAIDALHAGELGVESLQDVLAAGRR